MKNIDGQLLKQMIISERIIFIITILKSTPSTSFRCRMAIRHEYESDDVVRHEGNSKSQRQRSLSDRGRLFKKPPDGRARQFRRYHQPDFPCFAQSLEGKKS